jgi:hypothetical protein
MESFRPPAKYENTPIDDSGSLFTQVTLLWSSGAALSGDVALVLRPCRRGTDDSSDQHAVDLPSDVALEAADDLSLTLSLRGASCDVFLRATISSHASQADHVQRTVGFPIATPVETMPHDLAGGGLDGRDSAEAGEGGLTPQPLGIVFKATINSVAAWSVPMPAKETNSGATCATNRPRWASSWAISSERAS